MATGANLELIAINSDRIATGSELIGAQNRPIALAP
jgi:hypothetical protein